MKKEILAVLLLLAATTNAAGRRDADAELAKSMRASHVKTTGQRAIVWTPADWTAEKRTAVTSSLDAVIPRVESLLGRSFDRDAYGQPHIEYFITDADDVPSHVHGGYGHSSADGDDPIVFLSGLASGEAPHIHETAHIIGGPFGSLLLREGIATWTQFTLQPGKMRPLVNLGNVTDLQSLDAALPRMLMKPKNAEASARWLADPAKSVSFASRPERGLFYAVSASFVAFLIDGAGIETTMAAYASSNPAAVIEARTGKPWQQWAEAWLARTGDVP